MTQKILYFTAGRVPTVAEAADIAILEGLTEQPYSLVVMSNTYGSPEYGTGRPVPADYVAGTVPDSYKEEGTAIYPVFDPEDPPVTLPADKAIVTDGDVFSVEGGTVTAAVVENVVTFTFAAA